MALEKIRLSQSLSKKNPEKFIQKGTLLEQRRGDIDPISIPFRRLNAEIYNEQVRREDREYIVTLIGWIGIITLCLAFWMILLSLLGVI